MTGSRKYNKRRRVVNVIPPRYVRELYDEEIEDEDTDEQTTEQIQEEIISREVKSIDDLIELGNLYNSRRNKRKRYNIDVKKLYLLQEPLIELNKMIGMEDVKKSILEMIIYYIQDFETKNNNMLHTVIYGPSGCGKTQLATILAKIYCRLGFIKTDNVKNMKRSELIAGYLGQTAIKTQNVIDSAKEGVLLIDEAYSLGNSTQDDCFSKECLDTINRNLTENKNNFICIVVGYKNALRECFFSANEGLERRFPYRFTVKKYNATDLRKIYLLMIDRAKWFIKEPEAENIPLSFFEKNINYFTYNGGDMETLFQFTKIAHSRRVFQMASENRKYITRDDLENALQSFIMDDDIKARNKKEDKAYLDMMYL